MKSQKKTWNNFEGVFSGKCRTTKYTTRQKGSTGLAFLLAFTLVCSFLALALSNGICVQTVVPRPLRRK